nr:hypothetical protein [Tanacetum cinerariifolium]
MPWPVMDKEREHQGNFLAHEVLAWVRFESWKSDVMVWLCPRSRKELLKQSWFNELVKAEEELEEHELQNGSVVMFGKCMKRFLNKDKIIKEDLEGPAFELLKNRFHDDLSKPLPLVGPPGRKTIPTSYFFNHDLEYLRYGNEEKMYALLVTKINAVRYEQEGIKEMIMYL